LAIKFILAEFGSIFIGCFIHIEHELYFRARMRVFCDEFMVTDISIEEIIE
jgi:hypothetical protein